MIRAEILSIGDELLIGQTVNTNASFIGQGLTRIGIAVQCVQTVGDQAKALQTALALALSRSDLVIATGGLGPTHDDITKKVISEYFGAKLVLNRELLENLKQRFARRGIRMSPVNENQALVPEGAEIIDNPLGTAAGLIFTKDCRRCVVLPGVPAEMKAMCQETLLPMLQKEAGTIIMQKTLRTTGIPESTLFEQLGDIEELEQLAKVAFLPKATGVDIRLMTTGARQSECAERLQQALDFVQSRIGKHIYGYDEQSLEEAVAQLLTERGQTIAVAESCTGGLLAHRLTNISGSSAYFERGVVTYSNEAKQELLAVPSETLQRHGAVSAETAEAMATGIRKMARTDYGLSTTGIAGPTGGSDEKPVGLVYIGFASDKTVLSERLLFSKDRLGNKERSVQAALKLLRDQLE